MEEPPTREHRSKLWEPSHMGEGLGKGGNESVRRDGGAPLYISEEGVGIPKG
jgi:hypothetical protein